MASSKHRIKVHIVEDYKLIRIGILSVLRNDPEVEVMGESETAEEALINVPKLKPDIVLMDIGLPGISGIEASIYLKITAPESKIIMLTSHNDEGEVLASIRAGAKAFCLKEVPSGELLRVIKSVNSGYSWIDPSINDENIKEQLDAIINRRSLLNQSQKTT